jgi:hypothetical protein
MKALIPKLVDTKQTGFVAGRHIQDSTLTLKFAQEKARHSKEPVAMFLIDFSKAYDRVEHFYMCKTMQAMGFLTDFIKLIQGLVEPGSAKVHFNGLFTSHFPLQRGVR